MFPNCIISTKPPRILSRAIVVIFRTNMRATVFLHNTGRALARPT